MFNKIQTKLRVNILLTIGMVGIMGIINGFSRKFQKPILRCSLVDCGDYSNSNNPYPAQRLTMLKNCDVFLYFFQMALYIPIIPIFGACHEQC